MTAEYLQRLDGVPVFLRRHVVTGLITVQVLWTGTAWSQRAWSLFAPTTELPLECSPQALAVVAGTSKNPPCIALLAADRPAVYFYGADSVGTLQLKESCTLPAPAEILLAVHPDRDDRQEVVTSGSGIVSILRRGPDGWIVRSVEAPPGQEVAAVDINGDGRTDLLFYGRSTLGVATLLRTPRGDYQPGPTLFSEVSVGALGFVDINGDGILDAFLLAWLKNQVEVHYGISGTSFSDPILVDLPGEPGTMDVASLGATRGVRVAVTIPKASRVAVYQGTAVGEFSAMSTLEYSSPPSNVQFAEVSGGGTPELLTATAQELAVTAWHGATAAPAVPYGCVHSSAPWAVGDVDGDGRRDLAAADRKTRMLTVAWNCAGRIRGNGRWAVGPGARGVMVADVNADGAMDLVVANGRSNSVTLLLSGKGGMVTGVASVELEESPSTLLPVSGAQRPAFVVGHERSNHISLVRLGGDAGRARVSTMPTAGAPLLEDAFATPDRRRTEILVRSRDAESGKMSLSSFLEIGGRRFLERSVRATSVPRLSAITAGRSGSEYVLVFASADPATRRTTLYCSKASADLEFGPARVLFSFEDSTASSQRILLGGGRVGPAFRAVLVPEDSSRGCATFAFADTVLGAVRWTSSVAQVRSGWSVYRDVDGDGVDDLVVLDQGEGRAVVYRGEPGGGLRRGESVAVEAGMAGVAIGSFRGGAVPDLVYTAGSSVVVVPHPFRRGLP